MTAQRVPCPGAVYFRSRRAWRRDKAISTPTTTRPPVVTTARASKMVRTTVSKVPLGWPASVTNHARPTLAMGGVPGG